LAPVAAGITAGYGLTIVSAPGSITASLNQAVVEAVTASTVTTTSLVDVILDGMTMSPVAGK
jgi:hypothetical protein